MHFARPKYSLTLFLFAAAMMSVSCGRDPGVVISNINFDHTYPVLGTVLSTCVSDAGVNYQCMAGNRPSINRQIELMADVNAPIYASFTREQKLAFLINLHNLHAIRRVIDAYPIDSIEATRLLGSALNIKDIEAADNEWSLKSIRKKIMSDEFADSRAVFLLNWAMRGCAPLAAAPVTPATLDEMSENRTRDFIQNQNYNRYDQWQRKFYASRLIKDYRKQIERDYTTIWAFLAYFSLESQAEAMAQMPPVIEWNDWDKSLNAAPFTPPTVPGALQ